VAEDSVAGGLGKVLLGGAVGFALYFLVTGLGVGGRGEGEGDEGRGRGEPEAPPVIPPGPTVPPISPPVPLPPSPPTAPPIPPRPRDQARLSFMMTGPTFKEVLRGPSPMRFRLLGDSSARTYFLEEMIARIQAGGRSDVNLKIRGDVRQGSADDALRLLAQAGIKVWREEIRPRSPAVSGHARGQYGDYRRMR